ncbi:MAG TPA: hypothetical protein VLB84_12100, partial [Bacteroidia bacterium]|nr:hypothetical protein [Bacteroidia bacterium]
MKKRIVIISFLCLGINCYGQRIKEYNECAIELLNEKDYHGALQYYTRIIEISPLDSFAYFDRGLLKKEMNDFTDAIEDFSKAIEIDDKNADNYFLRAITKDQ